MLNDQFFMEDDVIFSLDDSIIEEIIPTVKVTEERFKDDAILRLNKDQINAEITNLIVDKYKSNTVLKSKVKSYSSLFFEFPQISHIKFKEVRPIIYSDKLTYFTSEDDHNQNKEYEHLHYLKSDKLSNFLTQFNTINRDQTKQSAIQSANKLYALYAPFANRESKDVYTMYYQPSTDVDAVRHCVMEEFECDNNKVETVRLLSKVETGNTTFYDGDGVNVIGFYNHVNNGSVPLVFDIHQYFTQTKSLLQGDAVSVIFNEPAFDRNGNSLVRSAKGTVVSNNGKIIYLTLKTPIMLKNVVVTELKYSLKTFDNPIFIYNYIDRKPQKEEDIYTKQKLVSHNIIFRLPKSSELPIDDIKRFVSPTTVGELILLHEKEFYRIFNLHDLAKYILIPNGVDINSLNKDTHHLLSFVFSHDKSIPKPIRALNKTPAYLPYRNTTQLVDFKKYAGNLTIYDKDYQSYDSFVDDALNRFRYLKSQKDKGAYYFLNNVKANLQYKYKKHIQTLTTFKKELTLVDRALDKLELPSAEVENTCEHRYAKEYKKIDKLLDDNDKFVFFDRRFDNTEYSAKHGFTGNSVKELRIHVLNELLTKSKYKKISKVDLEYEIDAIVDGKRRVRLGDVCVLHTQHGDVVYIRKEVEGKEMWVKQFRTPFKVCTDNPLINFNDLIRLDTCIRQSFDDVCRSNKNAKVLHKYRILMSMKSELSNVLVLLEKYESIIEVIENDIDAFKRLVQMDLGEHKAMRKFEHHEHIDYEEYNGLEGDVQQTDYQIDFNDQSNYVFTSSPYEPNQAWKTENNDNRELLNMLLSFIQIPLEEKEFSYILSNVNSKFPKSFISTTLQKYETSLMSQLNKDAYKTNEKYIKMFDTLIKQKMQKKEDELVQIYYFNVFRTIISMVIIIIFIRFPYYVMKVVLPSCVKVLSYLGHPVSDKDGQRSLVNYFACFLTNISVSDDIRFALFYEKDVQDIQKVLKDTIDEILLTNYELKTQLEITKSVMKTINKTIKVEHENIHSELQGFKPHFKFGNVDRMSIKDKAVVNYIKSVQEIVSKSKISKQSILNIPNLFNACCSETLKRDTNFFDFFEEFSEYKLAKNRLSKLSGVSFHDENLHPPQRKVSSTDFFSKFSIKHANTTALGKVDMEKHTSIKSSSIMVQAFIEQNKAQFENDTLLTEMVKHSKSNEWWDNVFYPKMTDDFDILINVLQKTSDKTNKADLEYIRDIVVNATGSEDLGTVRHCLHLFLSTKLRQIMGKIVNKQKLNADMANEEYLRADPLFAIIASVTNNGNYDGILSNLRTYILSLKGLETLHIETNDSDMVLKNISTLTHILVSVMRSLMFITINVNDFSRTTLADITMDINVKDKDNLKITSSIINYLLGSLCKFLQNTIVDPSKLKKTFDELREKRKQELMDAYKVDDEERQLQITLKKMGLDNWASILVGDDGLESEEQQKAANPQVVRKDEYQVEMDEVYQSFIGENDDRYDDDENDEDIAVSFEAYDN
jgi:hypothetical protein